MSETPPEMVTRLRAKMQRRADRAQTYSDYYDGKHPLKFASPEFSTLSGDIFADFADNWCQVVTDSALERLVPLGFRLGNGETDRKAMEAWRRSECDVDVSLALLDAMVCARSYALVWKPDGENTEITFEHLSQAIVEYVPGSRRKRSAGLKVWRDGSLEFATLFLPDMIYRFQRMSPDGGQWEDRTAGLGRKESPHFPNPIGDVPLVELANRQRLRGQPTSDIANVIPLQDSVNTLWAHLMTASDYLAVPARAVLGMDRPVREILGTDGEVIGEEDLPIERFRSDRLLWLEGDNASIAEFSAANLTNYTSVIEKAVQHIAAQTRTPPQYLLGQMVNISADALSAAESGLVAKVTERQRVFGSSLREIMRLEAIASGDPTRADLLAQGSVIWRDPQFRAESQYADALTKYKAVGVPDEALWERIPDVDSDVIARWKTMRDDQAAAIVGGDMAGLFGPKPELVPVEEAPQPQ